MEVQWPSDVYFRIHSMFDDTCLAPKAEWTLACTSPPPFRSMTNDGAAVTTIFHSFFTQPWVTHEWNLARTRTRTTIDDCLGQAPASKHIWQNKIISKNYVQETCCYCPRWYAVNGLPWLVPLSILYRIYWLQYRWDRQSFNLYALPVQFLR